MFRFGIRKHLIPHHPVAHDAMIGVTGAKGQIAIVDARVGGERPRPEIQPVGKRQSRQCLVRAVKHGKTLTSAEKGRDLEVTQQPILFGWLLHHEDRDAEVPRTGYRVMGSIQAPETSM